MDLGERPNRELQRHVVTTVEFDDVLRRRRGPRDHAWGQQERARERIAEVLLLQAVVDPPHRGSPGNSVIEEGMGDLMADAETQAVPLDVITEFRVLRLPPTPRLWVDDDLKPVPIIRDEERLHSPLRRAQPFYRETEAPTTEDGPEVK